MPSVYGLILKKQKESPCVSIARNLRALAKCSRQNVRDHPAMDIREAKIPATIAVGKLFMVDAHQVKDGGVQIMDMNLIFHGMPAKFVRCCAPRQPTSASAARQ